MKKVLIFLLFAAIVAGLYFGITKNKSNGTSGSSAASITADYEKIETVRAAMQKVSGSSAVRSFSDQYAWHEFDLRAIYQHDEEFYVSLREILGDDFDCQLSNGDYLFVGVMPANKSYRVFAGNVNIQTDMLYPEWTYTKLEKR